MLLFEKIGQPAAILLFIAGLTGMLVPHDIGHQELRSVQHLPIIGHILVFFLGTHLFYAFNPGFSARPMHTQILLLFLVTLLVGIIIEGLQSIIPGRTASIRDLFANITGAMIYLSLKDLQYFREQFLFRISISVITLFLLWPLFRSGIDERIAAIQFPLMAGFETPFEHTRFQGIPGRFSVSDEFAFNGKRSLKLNLGTEAFSGLSLDYFPSNWQGYSYFQLAIYNPQPMPVNLTVRIHDAIHEKAGMWRYADRYNRKFSLSPEKWIVIQISLEEIEDAPETRKMDMSQIRNIGFFVTQAQDPLILFLDDIRLR